MNNFHPVEVVGRTSETQLQVGENLYRITWECKVLINVDIFIFGFHSI